MMGMPEVEDHEVLDAICECLQQRENERGRPVRVSRESECVEFHDPDQDRWFEVVVREIDPPPPDDQADGGDSP